MRNECADPIEEILIERRENAAKRKRKGLKGISAYGGRMIRNSAHCLQKSYGRKRLAFWTLTLPSKEAYLILWVHNWAELVRKLIQKIQRKLRQKNAPDHVCGVTEIHPKRSEKMGWAVPHLHLITVGWDGITKKHDGRWQYYISHEEMQEMWSTVLENEIKRYLNKGEKPEEIKPRVNVQAVKKNAEGYLGKYMSKGKKDVEKYIADGKEENCLIRHWWHCTQDLRGAIKGMIKTLPLDILTAILQKVNLKAREVCLYIREIKKMIGDAEKTIGYVLKLTPQYIDTTRNEIIQALDTA